MKIIRIITIGKINKDYIKAGISDFINRLRPYTNLEIIELKEEGYGSQPLKVIHKKENEKIAQYIISESITVGLKRKGKEYNSEQFAKLLEKEALDGHTKITFIIGGTYDLPPQIEKQCKYLISFSKFTFPHQLFRLILLEQLYRAFKIIRGEPYHY